MRRIAARVDLDAATREVPATASRRLAEDLEWTALGRDEGEADAREAALGKLEHMDSAGVERLRDCKRSIPKVVLGREELDFDPGLPRRHGERASSRAATPPVAIRTRSASALRDGDVLLIASSLGPQSGSARGRGDRGRI